MGKSGYTKCIELIQKLINENKTELTENELKMEIGKEIGFSITHNTVNNYFNALMLFNLIQRQDGKFIIDASVLNDK